MKVLKAEQKCAEMNTNLEKSEIVAKLEAAEQKARMLAQIEANCFFDIKN
jgi:seryl-tRNA(Sec) selenium transferase